MEILSDATFKGNVSISGGETTPVFETKGWAGYSGVTIRGDCGLYVDSDEGIAVRKIIFQTSGGSYITSWSCLNYILDFAPASLSKTVSSNTTKINSVCTTVSSLCAKVNNLCTTVGDFLKFCRISLDNLFDNDVPADCTKFLICAGFNGSDRPYYMFMTKGTNPMSVANIDLEARCDSTTNGYWNFIATKSSGLAMCLADYSINYFYK